MPAIPRAAARDSWIEQQPDRRLRYKAGTFIVDRAIRKSGKSAAQLVTTPTSEILSALDK